MMNTAIDISDIRSGNKMAVARGLNLLENARPEAHGAAADLIEELSQHARESRHVIGITGPPGVGKSTLISRIIREYRSRGDTIGVISVDPSSKRSGGALLGDRARITYEPGDAGTFIRSMAAGGHLGGLAWRTRHCLTLFEAAFDVVVIETVGVGQSETEIEEVVDTVVFVVQPGSGDSLQFMKAGIMEIPHILVVNKSDQEELARKAVGDLKSVGAFGSRDRCGWVPRVITTSALNGWGQSELVSAMADHYRFLKTGDLAGRRRQNRIFWIYLMYKERFGRFGVETLGGQARISDIIEGSDVGNPFDGLRKLTRALSDSVRLKLIEGDNP
ncbi:MAG: methylmalonyl Co-A mutase-associated GTPase MeaB [Desulfobacterales bacterium]